MTGYDVYVTAPGGGLRAQLYGFSEEAAKEVLWQAIMLNTREADDTRSTWSHRVEVRPSRG